VLAPGTLVRPGHRAWIIDRYFSVNATKPAMRAAAHSTEPSAASSTAAPRVTADDVHERREADRHGEVEGQRGDHDDDEKQFGAHRRDIPV